MTVDPWPPRSDDDYFDEAAARLGPELSALFGGIRALIFDADGVLTTGNLIYGPAGEALKEFNTQDGLGLVMARVAGLKLAILTGRQSEIVGHRARELRFAAIKLGRFDKSAALQEILKELGCAAAEALYMGDDLVDLPALYQVGLPVTVPAAPAEVKEHCRYVTALPGGQGAVREVVDLVLKCRRLYGRALTALAEQAPSSPGEEDL
jgi:3-deoxy-D-manno-octulosonate 8-phosphate phosphatase (KDO 8-P phosphatase)